MIEAAVRLPVGAELQCDVCIVGGGVAGIVAALQFVGGPRSVVVLESGGWGHDARAQSLCEGGVAQGTLHPPTDRFRRRRFGGTSTAWNGRCVPFDAVDFEEREHVPHSGWPIDRAELDPYYVEANRLCELGRFDYSASSAPGLRREMIPGFVSDRVTTDGLERFSPPTDFARRYAARLKSARNVRVLLGATAVRLLPTESGAAIDRLEAAETAGGSRFAVRARCYILATGGLEVPRLLLASRRDGGPGVGDSRGLVGRFYMSHLAGTAGRFTPAAAGRIFHGYERTDEGVYCRRRLSLRPEVQRELGLGNFIARFHHTPIPDPSHRSGALSTLYLGRRLVPSEHRGRLLDGPVSSGLAARHALNVAADPLGVVRFLGLGMFRRAFSRRKYPSVVVAPRSGRFSLDFHAEQAPNPQSRVMLSGELDRLGMPKILVDWRYRGCDVRTVVGSLRVISEELEKAGVGRMELGEDLEARSVREGPYGGHHLGTTRMADDPSRGVVDRNCRVHGVDNLFVAGGSVFATSSQANPTLTVVALSIRLARHIASAPS